MKVFINLARVSKVLAKLESVSYRYHGATLLSGYHSNSVIANT